MLIEPDDTPNKIYLNLELPKDKKLSEEEKTLLEQNISYIKKYIWYWDIKDEDFTFTLPSTIFTSPYKIKGENYKLSDSIKYLNPEDEKRSPLRQEHLIQIWKRGQFIILSTNPNLPYTWKLSKWLVKGIENVKQSYIKDLGRTFFLLYYIKGIFLYDNNNILSIPQSIYSIYKFVYYTLDLLIGLTHFNDISGKIRKKIKHDELIAFINAHPEIKLNGFHRDVYKEVLYLENEFSIIKNKLIEEKEKEYRDRKMTKNEIKKQIRIDTDEAFIEFLNQNESFRVLNEKFKFLDFLYCQRIINSLNLEESEAFSKARKEFDKSLESHYIKINVERWKNEQIIKFKNEKEMQNKKEYNQKKAQQIAKYQLPLLIYNYNTKLNDQLEMKVKKLLEITQKEPQYVLKFYRRLTRPYEIEENNSYYYLKKFKEYSIGTSFPFWRIIAIFIKLFVYFYNINYWMFYIAFKSSVGLLALCSFELYTDDKIDISTGVVSQTDRAFTFPRTLYNLIVWIMNDRNEFESSLDTGIFGKGFTRIFNLFYNYIIKLLIFGGFIIVFYPLTILLCFTFCSIIIILSPIIVILFVFCGYLFNIIIYNDIVESFLFPIIVYLFYYLIFRGIIMLLLSIIIIILFPVLSLLFFIHTQIRFVIREIYDFIMYGSVKCLGKIPMTDSFLVWKIQGENLFRNRFSDLDNEDILQLIRGDLEKMKLEMFQQKSVEMINQPKTNINKISSVFSLVNLTFNSNPLINESINHFEKKLDKLIEERKKLYPKLKTHLSVKFSEEKLENVKNIIRLYLYEYAKEFSLDDIWEYNNIQEGNYDELVNFLLKRIFGKAIFETLEQNDEVVHIEPKTKNSFDSIATKLLDDPLFKDVKYVENQNKSRKEILTLPEKASFFDVFNSGILFLDLELLIKEEKENLIGNPIISIKKENEKLESLDDIIKT